MKLKRKIFALTVSLFMLLALILVVEGCVWRPAMSLTKFFYYEGLNRDLFGEASSKWPVEGLPVDVTYGQYHWHFVTDINGAIKLDGVPSGSYAFNWTWNGIPKTELLSICCAKQDWVFENFVDAKGRRAQ